MGLRSKIQYVVVWMVLATILPLGASSTYDITEVETPNTKANPLHIFSAHSRKSTKQHKRKSRKVKKAVQRENPLNILSIGSKKPKQRKVAKEIQQEYLENTEATQNYTAIVESNQIETVVMTKANPLDILSANSKKSIKKPKQKKVAKEIQQEYFENTEVTQNYTPVVENDQIEAIAKTKANPLDILSANGKKSVKKPKQRKIVKVIQLEPLESIEEIQSDDSNAENNQTETVAITKINPLDILSEQSKTSLQKVPVPKQKKITIEVSEKIHPENPNKAEKKKAYLIKRNQRKTIYLTFDDGPNKGTAAVMRVLKEEGVDATMFFIGRHIDNRRSLYRRAAAMPNLLIANHTYSHANGKYARFYSDSAGVIEDIDRAQSIIGGAKYLRLAGRNVWRLPSLSRNDRSLSKKRRKIEKPKYQALANRGYQIYGWDIEWHYKHDTGMPSYGADQMASRIEAFYNSGAMATQGKVVLLAHDFMFHSKEAAYKLRELIQILRANGWTFATIDSYSSQTPSVIVKQKNPSKKRTSPFDTFKFSRTTVNHYLKLQHATIQIALNSKQNLPNKQKLQTKIQ